MITLAAQGIKLAVQISAIAILARLLAPADFGLIAMITAVTGFLFLLKDGGLSMATMQSIVLSPQQVTNLFWINAGLGLTLMLITMALAPLVAWFYGEAKLVGATCAISLVFFMGGLHTQQQAMLNRQMRYRLLAGIEISAMVAGAAAGVLWALAARNYWALILMPLAQAAVSTLLYYLCCDWRPGLPKRLFETRAQLGFAGRLTVSGIAGYAARNADNLLIGWYWGAAALGYYNQAYRLLLMPVRQINDPLTRIAVPVLSRLAREPDRFRRYFLGILGAILWLTMPAVALLVAFADTIILLVLGPGWGETVVLFRALALAALVQPVLNALGWLYIATGRAGGFMKVSMVNAVVLIVAFAAALPFGTGAMAWTFSGVVVGLMLPLTAIACRDTPVAMKDVINTAASPVTLSVLMLCVALLSEDLLARWLERGLLAEAAAALVSILCVLATACVWKRSRQQLSTLLPALRQSVLDGGGNG
ncbi:MAG TPA: lipopolysaccharide biosynthesis protein [Pseudomonadales bacterium]|jgi:PST family polysaccharide transporter